MSKPLPTDGVQLEHGDTVILLCGKYDPAHIGYFRALEALTKRSAREIWITPLHSLHKRGVVQDMCTMLATEASLTTKRSVGCCLAALELGFIRVDDLLRWCRSKYPWLRFLVARLHDQSEETCFSASRADMEVYFAGQQVSEQGICLSQFLPIPGNLAERIASGSDESRNFLAPIWEYIQKNRLYRGPHVKV